MAANESNPAHLLPEVLVRWECPKTHSLKKCPLVITIVRNHFGNKADPMTPAEVEAIRDANPGRMMLYTTDQLL